MTAVASCASCRFSEVVIVDEDEPTETYPATICRRYPPAAGEWSVVDANDWCGEHEAGR